MNRKAKENFVLFLAILWSYILYAQVERVNSKLQIAPNKGDS